MKATPAERVIPDHYAIGAGGDGTPATRVRSGLYSKMSPGWHFNALQIASNVDSRIAFALPFFKTEMLAIVMPTFSESSVTLIFRFANMTSMLMMIAMLDWLYR
jgi:hypothetical protein